MSPADKSAEKRRMKSAARLYAVQALFQMESSAQTVEQVCREFETHRFGATYEEGEFAEGNADHFRAVVENAVNWQAAIDALPAAGGNIVLLEGTYSISDAIEIDKASVTLTGAGNNTTLDKAWDQTVAGDGLFTIIADDVALYQMKLLGNSGTHTDTDNNAIYKQTDGVSREAIAPERRLENLLQQQSVRRAAPVVLEPVGDHRDALRVHDGDAGAVVAERVRHVAAVVGVHEVHPVPQVPFTHVLAHFALVHELEIDAVPVPGDLVALDRDV